MSNPNQSKKTKHSFVLMAILFCLCGLLILLFPYNSLIAIGIIIGITVLVTGIIQIVRLLISDQRGGEFAASIVSSVFTIICSIVIMIFSKSIMPYLPMILGLFIIIDGAFKIDTSLCAKSYRLKSWFLLFLIAGFTIFCGFLCVRIKVSITNVGLISSLVGLAIFMCGFQNIFAPIYMGKIEARAKEEIKKRAEKMIEDEMMEEMFDEADKGSNDDGLTDETEISTIDVYTDLNESYNDTYEDPYSEPSEEPYEQNDLKSQENE